MRVVHKLVWLLILSFLMIGAVEARSHLDRSKILDELRTLEFTTSEVSSPDLALSPDGQWIIFTLGGKLFRLPIRGGEAEQLTFGPYFDANPAFSPDGKLVAFDSDRDGSEGNIFVLDLATKDVRQITHHEWADRPAWSPDGRSIVYLHLFNERRKPTFEGAAGAFQVGNRPPAEILKVPVAGGPAEKLRPEDDIYACFYLPNGDLAWAVVDIQRTDKAVSRVDTVSGEGKVTTLRTYDGMAHLVRPAPKGGILARVLSASMAEEITLAADPTTPLRKLANVSGAPTGFAQLPDASALITANFGHLWRVLPNGVIQAINFTARVKMQTRPSVPHPKWQPVEVGAKRNIRTAFEPQLLPDGSQVVFAALGDLWIQPFTGGAARQLTRGADDKYSPSVSPDGRQVAFLHNLAQRNEVQIVDIASGNVRTVGPGYECSYEQLSWSRSGELIYAEGCGRGEHRIIAIDPATSSKRVLVASTSDWEPQPRLMPDGKTLYYQKRSPEGQASVYRHVLPDGPPQAVFQAREDGLSTDISGDLIAQPVQNKTGVLVSRLDGRAESKYKYLPAPDGPQFSFLADGSGLVYVAGNSVVRESFKDGVRRSMRLDLQLPVPGPPPTLIENVRVLDFAVRGFTGPVSILLENGRIKQIGGVDAAKLPSNTLRIDGSGRFVIPGLFDAHTHGGGCGGVINLASGITSMRNMGGPLENLNGYADRSELVVGPYPRCFYPGRILEGKRGRLASNNFLHPDDEEDARRYIRLQKENGVSFVKLYYRLPWRLHREASAEAHRLGLPVAAHAQSLMQVVKGINLGYEYLTHWGGRGTLAFYDDVVQMAKAAGIKWDPTNAVAGGLTIATQNDPARTNLMNSAVAPIGELAWRGMHYEKLRTLRAAHRTGLPLMAGTDSGPYGLALHFEIQFLADAGIPPFDIIRSATLTTASAVGAEDQLGSVEVGKLADILLLDENPLEDIRNARKIHRVIKGGWVFDPRNAAKPLNN